MRLRPRLGWLLLPAGLLVLAPAPGRTDEATLRDGRRLRGDLTCAGGRWHFLPAGKREPVPAAELLRARLEGPPLPPLRAGAVQRVTLRDGQALTGVLLGLD